MASAPPAYPLNGNGHVSVLEHPEKRFPSVTESSSLGARSSSEPLVLSNGLSVGALETPVELVFSAAACHQGQPHRGVAFGYTAALARVGKLAEGSKVIFNDYRHDKHFDDPILGSYEIGRRIDQVIADESTTDPVTLTIGGDHTISYGTLMSTLRRDPDAKLIWIDAHSDINTPETSTSGNCHGMPVSYIVGLAHHEDLCDAKSDTHLKAHNLVYIGLRSVDPPEELILADLAERGMRRFDAAYCLEHGIEKVIDEISEHFRSGPAATDSPTIHISLDIDSIDPEFAPATGTPVEKGLHPTDVTKVIQWANSFTTLGKCHLDITEINPELSDLAGASTTYSTVEQVLDAYLS